ncbi:glycosyltransferase family 39 protein [Streptomyces sp. URMC 123]|uniref:glycosyltransferase family 39 protein n=1 Tax=Streptomyces sp. URMC 123 TaxID=3423403 RepID=UPI003F1AA79C
MLAIGLWGLERGTMWRDEAATFHAARRSLPDLWHLLGGVDAVHGLYYLLMHAVLAVRADEVALRLPSLLAAVCATGLVAALGCRLARPGVGLWAGLLYATSPFVSHFAQEGRSYALVAAGVALATLLLTHAVERGSAGRWAAYGAVTAVTALLHEFALLALAAHAVTLAVSRAPARVWRGWAAAACATVAVLAPLLLVSYGQGGQVAWIAVPGRPEARQLLHAFTGPAEVVYAVTLALMTVALLCPLPARPRRPRLTAVALPLAVVPPALLFAVSQREPLFVDRYVLFALAGVPLLAAAGAEGLCTAVRGRRAARRGTRRAVVACGAAVVAAGFLWQLPFHEEVRSPTGRPDDLAPVAALVRAETRPGDAIVFVPSYQRRVALAYPDAFAGRRDIALAGPVDPSGTLTGREVPAPELAARLAGLDRVWVVAVPGVEGRPWFRQSRTEQAKLALIRGGFDEVSRAAARSGEVVLHERVVRRPDR